MTTESIGYCPCCASELGIDDVGDIVVVAEPQLPTGHNRGIGGLVVVEAEPEWKASAYRFNQVPIEVETTMEPLTAPPKARRKKTKTDKALETAITNDLKNRGLK
jgi:hypothetical protein